MRRGSVAESYLDPLAATLESIRVGCDGWKRFLVFAALTKSRKGADYVALFAYFQFQGAVRLILAQGPRQVVNALTLYSVMQANLIPIGSNAATGGHSSFEQFFINVRILYNKQEEQAIILFTMLFTLVIWVISALSFIAACLLYVGFLWHYIPKSDGSLSNYCRRKIDRRLEKIVSAQVKKALERQEARQRKENEKARKRGNHVPDESTIRPTLPAIMEKEHDIKTPLVRQTSEATLPAYSTRAPTRQGSGDNTRALPYREGGAVYRPRTPSPDSSFTHSEYDEDGPLMHNAGQMGGFQIQLPYRPAYNRADSSSSAYRDRQRPMRTMTGSTHSSPTSDPASRRFPIRTAAPAQYQEPAIPLRTLTVQSQRSVSAPGVHDTAYDNAFGQAKLLNLPSHHRTQEPTYPGAWPTDPHPDPDAAPTGTFDPPYRAYAPPKYQPLQYPTGTQRTQYPSQQSQRPYTPFSNGVNVTQQYQYPAASSAFDPTYASTNLPSPDDPALQGTDFFDVEPEVSLTPKRTIVYRYPDPQPQSQSQMRLPMRSASAAPLRTATSTVAVDPSGGRMMMPPRRVATAPLPETSYEFRGYRGEMGSLGTDSSGGAYDVYEAHGEGLDRDSAGRLLAGSRSKSRVRDRERERERRTKD